MEGKRGGGDETILNPLWENRKYINALERKFNQSLPLIPVVVFTHANLVDDFGPTAVRVGRLQKVFTDHSKVLMGEVDQKSVIAILKE